MATQKEARRITSLLNSLGDAQSKAFVLDDKKPVENVFAVAWRDMNDVRHKLLDSLPGQGYTMEVVKGRYLVTVTE